MRPSSQTIRAFIIASVTFGMAAASARSRCSISMRTCRSRIAHPRAKDAPALSPTIALRQTAAKANRTARMDRLLLMIGYLPVVASKSRLHMSYASRSSASACVKTIDANVLQQLGHAQARAQHARLDGSFGDADDLRRLGHRFLVVVDEIDDLPVRRREPLQAPLDDSAAVRLLDRDFGAVCAIRNGRRVLVVELQFLS